MVKRVILTALFFILATSIYGILNTKALAVDCVSSGGWPGTCTEKSGCNWGATGIAWDNTKCTSLSSSGHTYGCCGNESGLTATNPTGTDSPCKFVSDAAKQKDCLSCQGVWTAIGCIAISSSTTTSTGATNLLGIILSLALGIAGGIAFLLILFGGLQIMTSAGNPEQLNAGRELITSAIIGLILILFSVFLLQFIGINIIGIPGFTPQ